MQVNNVLAEGGVMQEGGTQDPVSGNAVPPGAMQEEVRDDIDAKLSEGEFVFPADVVRYFGLQKLMALRDEAKIGLQKMAEIGQMGNAEEVENPEALHGSGAPAAASPAPAANDFGAEVDMALAETGQTEQAFAVGGVASPAKAEAYVNDAGQKIYVPQVNGNPVIDIPMGFTKEQTVAQTMQTPVDVQQPVQQFEKGGLGLRTHDNLPSRYNAEDNSYSTEVSITVTDPRLNKGRPTNIPSLWGGKEVSEDQAVTNALAHKGPYPSYKTIDEAVEAAQGKSAKGGADAGYAKGGLAKKRKPKAK
jgi:hypothetical protein